MGMNSTPVTRIDHTPYYSVLSSHELRELKAACKVSGLPFVAMACQPVPARQLISDVKRREPARFAEVSK